MIAKIAVSAANFSIDKPYSYAVPADMVLQPGLRVMVPFGRSNRHTEGVVLSVSDGDKAGLKQVTSCLDETPVLSGRMLQLAAFMRERYFSTFFDCIRVMLPAGLWFQTKDTYALTDDLSWQEKSIRQADAIAVLQLLRDCGGDVPLVTADGHLDIFLNGGMADGVLPALDFGYDHDILPVHFDAVGKLAPQVPQFHLEHWIGAFSHWDAPVLRYPAEDAAREVSQQLAQGIDFNLYMFHGGTNFGFFNGANHTADDPENRIKNRYEPDITSYDYDAPLTEWGECTPKYFAIQKEMERHLGKTLPKPARVPLQNIGAVQLNAYAPLFENLENIWDEYEVYDKE